MDPIGMAKASSRVTTTSLSPIRDAQSRAQHQDAIADCCVSEYPLARDF